MTVNALLMHESDNVVTCIKEVKIGQEVCYRFGDGFRTVKAIALIPYCHKVGILPIAKGGHILKYGECIGAATVDVPVGGWVAHHNVESIPRDYDSELI